MRNIKHISIYDENGNPKPGINVENLRKLGEALYYNQGFPLDVTFTMSQFSDHGNSNQVECGSVGCAVGHAPFLGIQKLPTEDFHEYGKRTLIDYTQHSLMYNWCFAGGWRSVDNTKKGAGQRILYLLTHGVPDISFFHESVNTYQSFTPCPIREKHILNR